MIDDDVGAFTCQPDGDRPADAARRARDQSNLSFEPATEIGHGLASFWRETKDPEGVQQDSPGRKPWLKGQIAESPERAAHGVRSQLQINARHKAPLWYRDQLHRPFGASLVTVLVPRACALGFPDSPLRG